MAQCKEAAKRAGLTELFRKQFSSISAGTWPCSLTKFTLRSSISVINDGNISIIEALLSGIRALHGPSTSYQKDLMLHAGL